MRTMSYARGRQYAVEQLRLDQQGYGVTLRAIVVRLGTTYGTRLRENDQDEFAAGVMSVVGDVLVYLGYGKRGVRYQWWHVCTLLTTAAEDELRTVRMLIGNENNVYRSSGTEVIETK